MNAIILAGGFGSRLRPLTERTPKPMLPIANRPMLDYVVAQLGHYYIRDAVFTLGYEGEQVKRFAVGYTELNARFSEEKTPLGTAGAVKHAERKLSEHFIVMSGDALSNVDLDAMLKRHFDSGALVTMAVTQVSDPSKYGVVATDEADYVTNFIEKPSAPVYGNLVNTGVYIVDKRVLSLVPKNEPFDFARNLFPMLISGKSISAYRHDGYWCDIGDKTSYFEANYKMLGGAFYEPLERKKRERISETTGTNLVDTSAIILGNASNCIIGEKARIASSARIKKCVVLSGATVTGEHENAIIGEGFVEKINVMPTESETRLTKEKNLYVSAL